jgi:hypothetical protein
MRELRDASQSALLNAGRILMQSAAAINAPKPPTVTAGMVPITAA